MGVKEDRTGPGTVEFEEFARATGQRLYRAAMLLTGDHHLAEDLTQATYARLFASWRRVRRTDHPVAYARTALFNEFMSHKRLRRNSERPVDVLPEEPVDSPGSDERLDLMAALAHLSPADRLILVCRYWEDRSVTQTAGELSLTEATVRSRSRRALARLRHHLEKEDHDALR